MNRTASTRVVVRRLRNKSPAMIKRNGKSHFPQPKVSPSPVFSHSPSTPAVSKYANRKSSDKANKKTATMLRLASLCRISSKVNPSSSGSTGFFFFRPIVQYEFLFQ